MVHPLFYLGVIIINITIDLNVTEENTVDVQNLIVNLVKVGAVTQEDARELFIQAEKLRGIEIK